MKKRNSEVLWNFIKEWFGDSSGSGVFNSTTIRRTAKELGIVFPTNYVPASLYRWCKSGHIIKVGEVERGAGRPMYNYVFGIKGIPSFYTNKCGSKMGVKRPRKSKEAKVKSTDGILDAAQVGESIVVYINKLRNAEKEINKETQEDIDRLNAQVNSLQSKLHAQVEEILNLKEEHATTIRLFKNKIKEILNKKSYVSLDLDSLDI
jgi:hypothetical protein